VSATELADQLERLRDQQRAVSSVSRAVARSEGLQPVLDEVVAAATRLCSANTGTLYVLQGDLLHALSLSQRVFAAVDEEVDARPVGELELKGFVRPVASYEVAALHAS